MDQLCFILQDIELRGHADQPFAIIEKLERDGYIVAAPDGLDWELTDKGREYLEECE